MGSSLDREEPATIGSRSTLKRDICATAGVCGVALVVVAIGHSLPGYATLPGTNGKLVYGHEGGCLRKPCSSSNTLEVVAPRRPTRRTVQNCSAGVCADFTPAWSGDGRRLVFGRVSGLGPQGGILVSQADGSGTRVVTKFGFDPAWSPDGRRLVFSRVLQPGGGNRAELHVIPSRGGRMRRLTFGGGKEPDWSVNGVIAFVRLDGRLRGTVYAMRPGGRARRVTRGANYTDPSWSPDGRRLVVERRTRNGENVFIIDRRGRVVTALTRRGGYSPVWSPDGRKIAYGHKGGLYTVNVDGTGRRRLVSGVGRFQGIDWQRRPR